MAENNKVDLNPVVDFAAGTAAGICALIVGYPLDTVKVRLQDPKTYFKYKSTVHTLVTIVREERVRGLFKGITSPLAGAAFLNGLVFSSYGFFMRLQLHQKNDEPSLPQVFWAGCGSGIVCAALTCPMELIKIRQQANLSVGRQPSAWLVARNIVRERGVRGLYKGFVVTAYRELGYGVYFWTYEGSCRLLRPNPSEPISLSRRKHQDSDNSGAAGNTNVEMEAPELSMLRFMIAGSLAGVTSWFSTFPFDVIKTRIQVSREDLRFLPTVRHAYNTEGWRVFFRGWAPTIWRSIPVNAVTFGSFELFVQLLSR